MLHVSFLTLLPMAVQTGYPWQPFHNGSQNTLEEVFFYLGQRAGTETGSVHQITADGVDAVENAKRMWKKFTTKSSLVIPRGNNFRLLQDF